MLELGVGADIFRSIGWIYLGLTSICVALAIWLPKHAWVKIAAPIVVLAVFGYSPVTSYFRVKERTAAFKAKYDVANAKFTEYCKTAGDKIYKTVENVEGIRLKKMFSTETRTTDPAWEAAAFARESTDVYYVSTFLYFEATRDPPEQSFRGTLSGTPSGIRGYQYVEVPKSGSDEVDVYTLREDKAAGFWKLHKQPNVRSRARYSVSVEDLPKHRDLERWIAGGLIRIEDMQTQEIVAEHRRFAFDRELGSIAGQRQQWLFADACPTPTKRPFNVRFFVDQVLKPTKESAK